MGRRGLAAGPDRGEVQLVVAQLYRCLDRQDWGAALETIEALPRPTAGAALPAARAVLSALPAHLRSAARWRRIAATLPAPAPAARVSAVESAAVRALTEEASALAERGDYESACAVIDLAAARLDASGATDVVVLAECASVWAGIAASAARFRSALAFYARSSSLALQCGHTALAASSAAGAALIQALVGRAPVRRARSDEAERLGGAALSELGLARIIAALDVLDVDEARRLVAVPPSPGASAFDGALRRGLLACVDAADDAGAALVAFDAAWAAAPPTIRRTPVRVAAHVFVRAWLLLLDGRARAARDLVASVPAYASSEVSAELGAIRAVAELACDDDESALRYAYLATRSPAKARGAVLGHAVIAAVLTARGDAGAEAACARAFSLAEENELPAMLALLPHPHLRAVLALSPTTSAAAAAIAEGLSSGRLRIPPRLGRLEVPLTSRERDVLQHLADGGRVASAAERLGLSPHTVRTHVRSIYRKLGVSSRSEMLAVAIEHGLL